MTAAPALSAWLQQVGAADAFAALAHLVDDRAVFAVDSARRVVLWSPGAERLLGFAADDVLGEHCLKSNRCAACIRGCGVAEHGRIESKALTLFDGADVPRDLLKSAQAFFDEQGRFQGAIELLSPATASPPEIATERALSEPHRFHGLLSVDPSMGRVFQTCRNVAETDATVLIRGESGTGKELVANALHRESGRRAGPFIAVNCAALTPSLMESELFGHMKGAFTGAATARAGIFEQASGGTLFLDEVAELPLELQAKLLRVLEEHAVVPVGASAPRPVDVRVVAATHRSLRDEVRRGRFREDLMYRLRVVPIFLPPLRERRGDIELLLRHFVERLSERGPRHVDSVAPEVMRALFAHDFPGNVRELRNVVEYAFAVGRGRAITLEDLPPDFAGATPAVQAVAPQAVPDDELERIRAALARHGGRLGETAGELGISRATLWRKRKKFGL